MDKLGFISMYALSVMPTLRVCLPPLPEGEALHASMRHLALPLGELASEARLRGLLSLPCVRGGGLRKAQAGGVVNG